METEYKLKAQGNAEWTIIEKKNNGTVTYQWLVYRDDEVVRRGNEPKLSLARGAVVLALTALMTESLTEHEDIDF